MNLHTAGTIFRVKGFCVQIDVACNVTRFFLIQVKIHFFQALLGWLGNTCIAGVIIRFGLYL
jgi:hypothetical protein